jgi:hypothetical protein
MSRARDLGMMVLAMTGVVVGACSPSLGDPVTQGGCQVYATDAVAPETVNDVVHFLASEGFCAAAGRRVQLAQRGDALELRIATRPESRDDAAYLRLAQAFAAQLSGKVLEGRPVDVAICDEELRVLSRAEGFRWGVHVTLERCGLYVGGDLRPGSGQRFLDLVKEDLGCDVPRSFRLSRGDDGLHLFFVLDAEALTSEATYHQARLTAGRASKVLFEEAPLTVHLADVYYASTRSAPAVDLGPMVTRGACTVFQGEGLTPGHLTRFMGFIDLAGYCEAGPKVYRLSRRDDGWHLSIVLREPIPPAFQSAFKTAFALVAAMLRGGVFDLAPTFIDLCDPVFEACDSIIGPDLGKAFILGTCSIFHDPSIDEETLARLRRWMGQERFCEDAEQLIRLRREGDAWAFHLAVQGRLHGTPELATLGARITSQLTKHVFEGGQVRFVGTNEALLPHTGRATPLSTTR